MEFLLKLTDRSMPRHGGHHIKYFIINIIMQLSGLVEVKCGGNYLPAEWGKWFISRTCESIRIQISHTKKIYEHKLRRVVLITSSYICEYFAYSMILSSEKEKEDEFYIYFNNTPSFPFPLPLPNSTNK